LTPCFLLASLLIQAPAQARDLSTVGTLIIAHGADSTWNAQVDSVARLVRLPGPVGVSFLMGSGAAKRRFQDVARDLAARGAKEIVVVPLFVASHSGHYDQVRYLAGETDSLDQEMKHHLELAGITRAPELVLRLRPAIDAAPEIGDVLAARALELATRPAEQAVLLVGHGPNSAEDYAQWMVNLRALAATLKEQGGFRHVTVELVRDDAPPAVKQEAARRIRELVTLAHDATGQPVIVVPVLVSRGSLSRRGVPDLLAGLSVSYSGRPLAPDPGVARWIERVVEEGT
jgi:sirohydrochlorin ferrochelatase